MGVGDGTCQPSIGGTAHQREPLRTPRPRKHHPNPGTDGEKIRNRTGAMGYSDKEEKVGE